MTFEAHVAQRLALGAREYGERSYDRPLAELLTEVLEECADVGAWSRIAQAVLDRRDDLDGAEREAIAEALRGATLLAAGAWRRLHGALAIDRGAA